MRKNRVFLALLAGLAMLFLSAPFFGGREFTGMDERTGLVVERYAQEVGVGERPPLINTDRGDLLLFLFALSGLAAGFYLGHQWRDLFGSGKGGFSDNPGPERD